MARTLQIDFPDDLDQGLDRLVEAGHFKSREELVLKAVEQLLDRLGSDGQPSEGREGQALAETQFRQNRSFFESEKRNSQARYGDAFVAVWEEQVVDHDKDRSRLAERVYKRFSSVPIYIDQPSMSPARFSVSSPILG